MFAKIAVSVAVGFLGAYPLASATGLLGNDRIMDQYQEKSFIVSGGIILFFLTLALIGPTLRLVRQILDTLSRVEERPRSPFAGVMLLLGTTCVISAVLFQYNAATRPPATVSMNIPGFNGGNNVGFNTNPGMVIQSSGSFGLGILTILTFLLGASMIGLGTWASIKPSAPSAGALIKPEAREFAEVAT